jgi:XTP/dITP diphosphohydrolase
MENNPGDFNRLVSIMDELREKCPWDRKQTIHSLRQLTIEELYELADAITEEDWQGMREELGDLLLHVVFYALIASEQGRFTMADVIEGICEKLIARHPHIYGDVQADDEHQVARNWEKLKLKEGKTSVLSGVPGGLPALVKAIRIQEKAAQTGFEWENILGVREKIAEEMAELDRAIAGQAPAEIEEELGDVFFSMVNYARFLHVDAENALEVTNKKFIARFRWMEQEASAKGEALQDMTLAEMDALWNAAKNRGVGSRKEKG